MLIDFLIVFSFQHAFVVGWLKSPTFTIDYLKATFLFTLLQLQYYKQASLLTLLTMQI